ncbi:hypothetical protein [Microbacterium sp.]|uniref:hypothetical protein n=1 Tax=Microbacterium sp. TaxID=51671 RepID=UPI003F7282F4
MTGTPEAAWELRKATIGGTIKRLREGGGARPTLTKTGVVNVMKGAGHNWKIDTVTLLEDGKRTLAAHEVEDLAKALGADPALLLGIGGDPEEAERLDAVRYRLRAWDEAAHELRRQVVRLEEARLQVALELDRLEAEAPAQVAAEVARVMRSAADRLVSDTLAASYTRGVDVRWVAAPSGAREGSPEWAQMGEGSRSYAHVTAARDDGRLLVTGTDGAGEEIAYSTDAGAAVTELLADWRRVTERPAGAR